MTQGSRCPEESAGRSGRAAGAIRVGSDLVPQSVVVNTRLWRHPIVDSWLAAYMLSDPMRLDSNFAQHAGR